jgi:alpha-L-fucosidase
MRTPLLNTAALCSVAVVGMTFDGTANAADKPVTKQADRKEVAAEHGAIGIDPRHRPIPGHQRTQHPDAQWFPDAGLGLFLHWDPACTRPINIGWSMIPGRKLLDSKITPAEFERIVREQDFNLDGKKWPITPNEYWALAKDFNPDNYHPEVWLKKAKESGFTYAVLTTKHHAGFAMWPSAYGEYNTKNYMNGRDLVKEYVEACRKAGLKVGLYFSGPDWHFEREFRNFLYRPLPGLPALGPDLQPRATTRTPEEIAAHQKAYAEMVRGQVEELLTNYGKIDLLWFDGRPPIPDAQNVISQERIRELQPGIVINTRMHGKGDYITPERVLPETLRLKSDEWGEFCSPWNYWSYSKSPFRPLNTVLTELVRARNAGVNYLLGFGPMANGDWAPEAYENVAKLAAWMKINGEAIHGTRALPAGEKASVLASAKGDVRYLYLLPGKTEGTVSVSFTGWRGDCQARLLGDTRKLEVTRNGDVVTMVVPSDALGETVRVLELSPN